MWAVRCFHKTAPDREKRYKAISKFISLHKSGILIKVEYQPEGIRYTNRFYPLTAMEWIEGETLGTFIYNNINHKKIISQLPDQFLELTKELDRLKIAHGDLSPEEHSRNKRKDDTDRL
jgi:predicted Ser/Thr protein kinase